MIQECLNINNKGHLEIGGCDCVELAKEFGTPLYVIDEATIRANCRKFKDAFVTNYEGQGLPIYASKALSTKAIVKIMQQEGMGLDVVSGGEIYTALKAGFPADKMFFHGNNKTYDELVFAVENNIGRIIVDNLNELNMLSRIAKDMGREVNISLRITPGIEAHTHEYVQTGQIDSKFGIPFENNQAFEAVRVAASKEDINLMGIHCHIGSQIFETECFEFAVEVMIKFMAQVKNELGHELTELNLGGGFGIKYTLSDFPKEYNKYIELITKKIEEQCSKYGLKKPYLYVEPGRAIVAPAGITLYTIGSVKDIIDVRRYVAVDGGMGDNPRYALYQSRHEGIIANKPNAEKHHMVTVCGKCCESGDILIKDILMPQTEPGDILAVLHTGAYNYSMASNYNRIPKPAMVLVKDGQASVIVRRESYEDLIKNDILPENMK